MRRLNAIGDTLAIISTRFQGTWLFLFIHAVWWTLWKALHLPADDLTLAVSLEAIVQTSMVAMGQRLLSDQVRAAAAEAPKNVATAAPTCRHCRESQA